MVDAVQDLIGQRNKAEAMLKRVTKEADALDQRRQAQIQLQHEALTRLQAQINWLLGEIEGSGQLPYLPAQFHLKVQNGDFG